MKAVESVPHVWYWAISIALLLWAIGGAAIYIAFLVQSPDEFARTAETAAKRQAYTVYIESMPLWAIAAGTFAAVARLIGAIGLVRRRAWARPLLIASLIFFICALFRAFVVANAASFVSVPHIVVELAYLVLGVFAVWFAYANRKNGTLK